ncbi:hypothetical protein QUB56_20670 [Microcoleus sp. AR_TQ3_B6]|uniref:hypothetical protein n=1 Tax=Microcoleus sp. AR_TQ3_B6 TaxID=3055284 RepID=UPI002FCED12A
MAVQRPYSYSLPESLIYSICLWRRYRWFVQHKLTSLVLNDEPIARKTKELESRHEGEAIIVELCHPQSRN